VTRHPLASVLVGLTLLAVGCPRPVPEHLRVDPPKEAVGGAQEPSAIQDLPSAVAAIVGSDPLVRSPTLPALEVLRDVPGAAPLADYVRSVRQLEGGEGQVPRSMQQLEDDHRGSEAVALARGYRLRVTENLLASPAQAGPERDSQILALLTPLTSSGEGATLNRAPLDWLSGEQPLETRTRAYAERWTLAGWLDAPGVNIGPAGSALGAPMYDGLSDTPMGVLVASRARGDQGDEAAIASALDDLRTATRWALQEAAADRDTEQAAWAATKAEAKEALGDDPIDALLARARSALEPAGGRPEAVGGALLAHAGRRWRGTCSDAPCVGLDRVDTMAAAARWGPEVAPIAHVWQVIALKDALDTMDVAHDTVMYPRGALALVDAVLGTGGGPLEDQVLRKRSPDEGVWLVLARGVGVEGVTSWDGARAALGAHLQQEAQRAKAELDDPEMASYLDRIAARAIP
jgi:hypothetical protein